MSYILEALKKSESERQQASSPPSIYSPKPPPPVVPEKDPKRPRLLLWSGLIALVILVCTAGYHLYGNKMISITISVPQQDLPPQTQNTETKIESDPVPRVESVPEPPISTPVIQTADDKMAAVDETISEPEEQLPESLEAQVTPAETINNRPYVPRLEELDTAFQNIVPDLKLAGHVYSEDASLRMILINDHIVREKGAAAKGIILDEITPDGIILRKDAIRFRIDIP